MYSSRFIIGIDLGTTNIAVTYIDTLDSYSGIKLFKVPQLSAPGECREFELFPSFCFFRDDRILPDESVNLPWHTDRAYVPGVYARDFGAAVPGRFASSVKSWLCHGGVDRKGRILPWGSQTEDIKKSPLEITSFYLKYIRDAWNWSMGRADDESGNPCVLEEQQVVITVPASFDETARELTLEAAQKAGYRNINLLEEPLAAFYSWIDLNPDFFSENTRKPCRILVIDIGGGTTDFSIIELDEHGVLSRTAAGSHLLLGGDNIDNSLARKIEENWGRKLSISEWLALCQSCRQAKEKQLSSDAQSADVTLLAQGSSIVGNVMKCTLGKSEIENLLLEGFFNEITTDSPAPQRKKGIQEMGLPYETDPSVSRHLLQFLRYAYSVSERKDSVSEKYKALCPDMVLFNGGTMIPEVLRIRVVRQLNTWFDGSSVREMTSRDLSLAVAYGASYFGRTRRGTGVKVRSGTTASFFLKASDGRENQGRLVCIMPRGTDEGHRISLPNNFIVGANRKAVFPLYSSSTVLGALPGSLFDESEEFSLQSELTGVIRFGKNERKDLKTELVSELTETGVLKVYIKSKESSHVWPLKFDVRFHSHHDFSPAPEILIDRESVTKAALVCAGAFSNGQGRPVSAVTEIENILEIPKEKWPIGVLRSFVDALIPIPYKSLTSPEKESAWLNLCGYCMRPGFGDPEDELRMRKLWEIWNAGINNRNAPQVVCEWWTFWRRCISGLKAGHHVTVYNELSKQLFPRNLYAVNIRQGVQAKTEMWRCIASLELLPVPQKTAIGDILTGHAGKLQNYEYWCLARLGSRHPVVCKADRIIARADVAAWLEKLLSADGQKVPVEKLFAISRLAALTGDRSVDVSLDLLEKCLDYMRKNNAPVPWTEHLERVKHDTAEEQASILGDTLPLGLSLEQHTLC